MKHIQNALSAATKWEMEKNFNWATRNYDSALIGLLSISVCSHKNSSCGTIFLKENDTTDTLIRALNSYDCLLGEILNGELPASVIGGNFHLCVLAHLGWLLREFDGAQRFVEYACDPRFQSTKFLTEYAHALASLIGKSPYHPQPMALRGLEKYWWEYLLLISDITNSRSTEQSVGILKASFVKKNQDKRLDDNYDIEGTGKRPVRWDFRLASIQVVASDLYGIQCDPATSLGS